MTAPRWCIPLAIGLLIYVYADYIADQGRQDRIVLLVELCHDPDNSGHLPGLYEACERYAADRSDYSPSDY